MMFAWQHVQMISCGFWRKTVFWNPFTISQSFLHRIGHVSLMLVRWTGFRIIYCTLAVWTLPLSGCSRPVHRFLRLGVTRGAWLPDSRSMVVQSVSMGEILSWRSYLIAIGDSQGRCGCQLDGWHCQALIGWGTVGVTKNGCIDE